MSFLTCFCDFPQKEHFSRSPPSPNFATRCSQLQEPTWLRPYLRSCDCSHLGRLFKCRTTRNDLVDYTVGFCFFRRHDEVSVTIFRNFFDRLTSVIGKDLVEQPAVAQDLARLDLDIHSLSTGATRGLVDEHARVRQAVP